MASAHDDQGLSVEQRRDETCDESPETRSTLAHVESLLAQVRLPDPSILPHLLEPPSPGPLELPGFAQLELLGQGSFGCVYLARDERLERRVAIKVPHATRWGQPADARASLREARLAAQLVHPGIVTLLDVVEWHDRFYVVTEYVAGGTLEQRLAQSPIPATDAAELVSLLADALAYAHRANVVHRDLKPANILLDEGGHPRIADFGLAIRDDQQGTELGRVAGTLEYMAPEQLPGSAQYVDGRTDIWSLGVVFYQMLTGKLPFAGANREDVAREIRQRAPKPPRQIDPTIPAELERICLLCLEKNIERRSSSATEIADQLRNYLQSTRVPARSRRGMLLGATASVAVIAASLSLMVPWRTTDPSASEAIIKSFRVHHFRFGDDPLAQGKYLGLIGSSAARMQFEDEVRIEIAFHRPTYFYLVELTSVGTLNLCYPASTTIAPQPVSRWEFPGDAVSFWCLDDAPGTYAFCLIASEEPLPSFSQSVFAHESWPWAAQPSEGVWRFTNNGFESGFYVRERGTAKQHGAAPNSLRALCDFLTKHAGTSTVQVVSFPVAPPVHSSTAAVTRSESPRASEERQP